MSRRPYAGFLQGLDSFLREDQRQAAPDVLSRYRVVVAAVGSQFLMSLLYLLTVLRLEQPGFQLPLAVGCAVGYGSLLVLVRKVASPRYPGLLLCLILAAAYISAGLHLGNSQSASHVASTLIPLLAFFLLGVRVGFAFAALMGLYALLLQPLALVDFDVTAPAFSGGLAVSGNLFAALCIMGVWGLSYMHTRARDEAREALEHTYRSLRDSERKLSGVLESTDDLVSSLDAQARLVTANAAMKRWYTRLFGQEPRLGEPLASPVFLERHPEWPQLFSQALGGERVRVEVVYRQEQGSLALDFSLTPLLDEAGHAVGVTIFGRDVTARREAETRLGELHRSLVDTSRKAGMAEIATGVLHNVGNTLNSVNVSANLVVERLRESRVAGLTRAAALLQSHVADLGTFLTRDEKGRLLPEYFVAVSRQLAQEQTVLLAEVKSLTRNVEHIKSVVSMQQEHARFSGVIEQVSVPELIDDALRLHATAFERLGIHVRREYAAVPDIMVDRHKLLQILVNLLSNARHALLEGGRPDKLLSIRVAPGDAERLRIEVADNGVGIAQENLARIFTQGFTTKRNGHGFGLHTSALAATEMKGSLTCASAGREQGACFTIELPCTSEGARA